MRDDIWVFHTVIPEVLSDDRTVQKGARAKALHDAAWGLLADTLHRADPHRFPDADVATLPAIERLPHGKPVFADGQGPHFSLSHSGRIAVCAISEAGPVGIDVQEIGGHKEIDGIVRRFFHPAEQEFLKRVGPAHKDHVFYELFSCKEAFIKMTGKGLTEDLTGFCIERGKDGCFRYVRMGQAIEPAGYLSCADEKQLPALAGCVLAVCSGQSGRVNLLRDPVELPKHP
ncbi:MAG: 4'-phosphopantetheinyl transferase superfamily protein [Lachnospiraceae bacterium]|nr:4'-phosphopantetheinyl transferase superfamily protein [Lachnospiraceae bacterium]